MKFCLRILILCLICSFSFNKNLLRNFKKNTLSTAFGNNNNNNNNNNFLNNNQIQNNFLYKNSNLNEKANKDKDPGQQALNKINDLIANLANKYHDNTPPDLKGLKNGGNINPNTNGKGNQARGLANRDNDKDNPFMKNPTDLFRTCPVPDKKVSYPQVCDTKDSVPDPNLKTTCKLSFCNVCCNELEKMLTNAITNNPVGAAIYPSTSEGVHDVHDAIKKSNAVKQCKDACFVSFIKLI